MAAADYGVAAIHATEESGPVIRLDGKHLPDLDELLLYLAQLDSCGDVAPWWEDRYNDCDAPMLVDWRGPGELRVQWLRMVPCSCAQPGEQPHGWHIDQAYLNGDGDPRQPRGAFLGVWEW